MWVRGRREAEVMENINFSYLRFLTSSNVSSDEVSAAEFYVITAEDASLISWPSGQPFILIKRNLQLKGIVLTAKLYSGEPSSPLFH